MSASLPKKIPCEDDADAAEKDIVLSWMFTLVVAEVAPTVMNWMPSGWSLAVGWKSENLLFAISTLLTVPKSNPSDLRLVRLLFVILSPESFTKIPPLVSPVNRLPFTVTPEELLM